MLAAAQAATLPPPKQVSDPVFSHRLRHHGSRRVACASASIALGGQTARSAIRTTIAKVVTASSAFAANGAFEASRRLDAQKVPLRHHGAVAHVGYEGPVPKIAAASAAVGAGGVAERAATLRRDAISGSQSGLPPLLVLAWVYSARAQAQVS